MKRAAAADSVTTIVAKRLKADPIQHFSADTTAANTATSSTPTNQYARIRLPTTLISLSLDPPRR